MRSGTSVLSSSSSRARDTSVSLKVFGGILLVELVGYFLVGVIEPGALRQGAGAAPANAALVSNTEALGRVLYTQYVYYFEAAGMILLVAMIGAIVLTLRHKAGVKRQDIAQQAARGRDTAIEVRKVTSRQGV